MLGLAPRSGLGLTVVDLLVRHRRQVVARAAEPSSVVPVGPAEGGKFDGAGSRDGSWRSISSVLNKPIPVSASAAQTGARDGHQVTAGAR